MFERKPHWAPLTHDTTMRILGLLFLFLLHAGCGVIKTARLMKQGEVRPATFTTVAPMTKRMGLMIINVRIRGKEYDFLLDSGAPNVINPELAATLGLGSKVKTKAGDSQGNKDQLDIVVVDSLRIGDITFLNTAAAVADLHTVPELACLNVSGFIGTNLMRKAIWCIDDSAKAITITSDRQNLLIPPEAVKVDFVQDPAGTPHIDIGYNQRKQRYVAVDFGYSGALQMDRNVYEGLITDGELGPTLRSTGSTSVGLYGGAKSDSLIETRVARITVGGSVLENKMVTVTAGKKDVLLGMKFFAHYRTVLDWNEKTVTLIPNGTFKGSGNSGFGFTQRYADGQLLVGALVHGSTAEKKGLRLGDRIVQWNGTDRSNVTRQDYCAMLDKAYAGGVDTLRIAVLRGEERIPFVLPKEVFVPE